MSEVKGIVKKWKKYLAESTERKIDSRFDLGAVRPGPTDYATRAKQDNYPRPEEVSSIHDPDGSYRNWLTSYWERIDNDAGDLNPNSTLDSMDKVLTPDQRKIKELEMQIAALKSSLSNCKPAKESTLAERIADQTMPIPASNINNSRKIEYSKLLDAIRGVQADDVWWGWVDLLNKAFCSTQGDSEACQARAKSFTNRSEIEEFFRNL
tara:strand:- start:43865 stop:44491 length:627 start_codon:yes stop_codon:yes gene_type:complete